MKKAFLGLLAIAFITLASCSKDNCKVCKKEGASSVEICESTYSSNTAYGMAVDAQELLGYECKDGKLVEVTVPN